MKQTDYDDDLKKKSLNDLLINFSSKDNTIKNMDVDLFEDILQTC